MFKHPLNPKIRNVHSIVADEVLFNKMAGFSNIILQ